MNLRIQKKIFIGTVLGLIVIIVTWNINRTSHDLCFSTLQNSALVVPSHSYVLLVAYPRSGSTFTGELLSVRDDVFYLYEPSYEYISGRHIEKSGRIVKILNGIFTCKNRTLEMFDAMRKGEAEISFFYPKMASNPNFHDLGGLCRSAKAHIIKTVRLPMETAKDLLFSKPLLDLKIIHLVRDPRAMVNSLNNNIVWSNVTKSRMAHCDSIRKDLRSARSIPKGNYIRIRYEDITDNILDSMARLYQFIGLELSDSLVSYIMNHTNLDEVTIEVNQTDYFETYRSKDFNPNEWRDSLDVEYIREIENACKDVLEELNYEIF